jgi:hypothetical protein
MNIPNLQAVKARQKATWESGDFGQVAKTIMPVAEQFIARLPLRPGSICSTSRVVAAISLWL